MQRTHRQPLRVIPRIAPMAAALAASLLAALPHAAQAARIDYEIGASVLRTDNIGLVETDAQSDTVLSPWLGFHVTQAGSRLQLDARGTLQYLDYTGGSYDNDVRGDFRVEALWTMIPERLTWTFEDYLSPQPVNTFNAFTPDNEQEANYFITGPTLLARMGPATRGEFDLRFATSQASDNDSFNSNRYNAAARIFRDIGPDQALSFNVEANRIVFDTTLLQPDYNLYVGYVRYTRTLSALDLDVDLGYSRLAFNSTAGNDTWLPLVRVDVAWKTSPRGTLQAGINSEFSDAAENLVINAGAAQIGNGIGTGNGVGTGTGVGTGPGGAPGTGGVGDGNPAVPINAGVYKLRRAQLGYTFTGVRLAVETSGFYQRIAYIDLAGLDETDRGAYVEFTYALRPRTSLALLGALEERSYTDTSRTDRDRTWSLSLQHRFTRHWSALAAVQRRTRDSTEPGQGYEQNGVLASITYRR